jgi:DNA-binding response OmpR family regulator
MNSDTDEGTLPNALVVDDEKEVADAYVLRLRGTCNVEAVYDGEQALETLDSRDVDVVLLDRHMPGLSGDEVLSRLADRDYYGKVIMVTAIDPGFDVLDMPFDDYLCKPLERADVTTAVEQQCEILGYEMLGEYFSVESRRNVIEAQLPEGDLEDNTEYADAERRAERLEERVGRLFPNPVELFERFEGVQREGR